MPNPNEPTTAAEDTAAANQGLEQGLGQGQREMDAGRDPSRTQSATAPEQRSFQSDADMGARDAGDVGRDAAGMGDVAGDLGAGTPANVDVHDLGQADKPEQDWGEAAEGATYSANHTRRADHTEAERGQGAKTRAANKDQVSRRS